MDIVITTSDPNAIDICEVRDTLVGLGYFVASVTVKDRAGFAVAAI